MEVVGVVSRDVDAKPEPPWAWRDVFDESKESALSRAGSILEGILKDVSEYLPLLLEQREIGTYILIVSKGKNECRIESGEVTSDLKPSEFYHIYRVTGVPLTRA